MTKVFTTLVVQVEIMRPAKFLLAVLLVFSAVLALGRVPLAELPQYALQQSQLTSRGSKPFHIKVQVVEETNLKNDSYKAEIEEYWVSPDKWRRTVKTSGFSQTIVVNGGKISEVHTGSYYPNWMRTFVAALFDPDLSLQGVQLSQSQDNPMIGGEQLCRRFGIRLGIAPVSNTVFASYCFQNELLDSIGKPGYHAEYKDYRKFAGKQVARRVIEYIEPGTELQATITELRELAEPESPLFEVQQQTQVLSTVFVPEQTLRSLAVDSPEVKWPSARGGKPVGVLSIYVCLDQQGKVRETYALNSDHPEMADAARKQVAGWRFRPASVNGQPVQVEAILTFAYQTKIEDTHPVAKN